MEGSSGNPWVCGVHGAQLSAFTVTYLRSVESALGRLPEAEPILQAILQATDDCPECQRRVGEREPRRLLIPSASSPNLWPEAFLNITCTRTGDGPWTCTYDAGVKRKVLLLGDASARKTEMVRPAMFDQLPDSVRDFLGAKVMSRHQTVRVPDEGMEFHVTFSIWDITGHRISDKHRLRTYFHGAKTVLAACDLSNEQSVHELDYWLAVAERILGKTTTIIVARVSSVPDPLGIAEARLAELARTRHATIVPLPISGSHPMEHLFEGLGAEAIHEVFGTRWWPRMYR